MAEKNRVRNLSTRWLVPFKVTVFTIYTGLCSAIVFSYLRNGHNVVDWIFGAVMAAAYVYIHKTNENDFKTLSN